jgi:hypothetical protein
MKIDELASVVREFLEAEVYGNIGVASPSGGEPLG